MRLRGFSVMTNILEDYHEDIEVKTLVIITLLFLVWRNLIRLNPRLWSA